VGAPHGFPLCGGEPMRELVHYNTKGMDEHCENPHPKGI